MESYYTWFFVLAALAGGLKFYEYQLNKKEESISTASADVSRPLTGKDESPEEAAIAQREKLQEFKVELP